MCEKRGQVLFFQYNIISTALLGRKGHANATSAGRGGRPTASGAGSPLSQQQTTAKRLQQPSTRCMRVSNNDPPFKQPIHSSHTGSDIRQQQNRRRIAKPNPRTFAGSCIPVFVTFRQILMLCVQQQQQQQNPDVSCPSLDSATHLFTWGPLTPSHLWTSPAPKMVEKCELVAHHGARYARGVNLPTWRGRRVGWGQLLHVLQYYGVPLRHAQAPLLAVCGCLYSPSVSESTLRRPGNRRPAI